MERRVGVAAALALHEWAAAALGKDLRAVLGVGRVARGGGARDDAKKRSARASLGLLHARRGSLWPGILGPRGPHRALGEEGSAVEHVQRARLAARARERPGRAWLVKREAAAILRWVGKGEGWRLRVGSPSLALPLGRCLGWCGEETSARGRRAKKLKINYMGETPSRWDPKRLS